MDSEIDPIDLAALIIIPIMGAIALGTVTLNVNVFGGFSFQDVIWSGSGMEVTWASVIVVAAVAWIVATNELDGSDYEQWEYAVIAVGFLIVPAYIAIPIIQDVVTDYDLIGLALVVVQSAAAIFISWTE